MSENAQQPFRYDQFHNDLLARQRTIETLRDKHGIDRPVTETLRHVKVAAGDRKMPLMDDGEVAVPIDFSERPELLKLLPVTGNLPEFDAIIATDIKDVEHSAVRATVFGFRKSGGTPYTVVEYAGLRWGNASVRRLPEGATIYFDHRSGKRLAENVGFWIVATQPEGEDIQLVAAEGAGETAEPVAAERPRSVHRAMERPARPERGAATLAPAEQARTPEEEMRLARDMIRRLGSDADTQQVNAFLAGMVEDPDRYDPALNNVAATYLPRVNALLGGHLTQSALESDPALSHEERVLLEHQATVEKLNLVEELFFTNATSEKKVREDGDAIRTYRAFDARKVRQVVACLERFPDLARAVAAMHSESAADYAEDSPLRLNIGVEGMEYSELAWSKRDESAAKLLQYGKERIEDFLEEAAITISPDGYITQRSLGGMLLTRLGR